jgi:hypothetical protein
VDDGATMARPRGISALSAFFGFGTLASGLSALSLLNPGGPLEPMWRLNPHSREAFSKMGTWAPLLLGLVCLACAFTAQGLFRSRRSGYYSSIALLLVDFAGNLVNAGLGVERRAWVGIPIVGLLLWYLLSRKVRAYFDRADSRAPMVATS